MEQIKENVLNEIAETQSQIQSVQFSPLTPHEYRWVQR